MAIHHSLTSTQADIEREAQYCAARGDTPNSSITALREEFDAALQAASDAAFAYDAVKRTPNEYAAAKKLSKEALHKAKFALIRAYDRSAYALAVKSWRPGGVIVKIPARTESYIDLVTIELSAHPETGTSFNCEVHFTVEPGDYYQRKIVAIRPFERGSAPSRLAGQRNLLPCPDWLEEILRDAIDIDALRTDRG